MIGLDTNVLARLFIDDDPVQARSARQFVAERCSEKNPAFIDRVALCELVWVLSYSHGYGRAEIVRIIGQLLESQEIILEDADAVGAALRIFSSRNIDFADALIGEVNRARGCEATATFDRKAAKLDGFVSVI
ncbi:MAG: type II toxin-antitoxin system VapC family toxin [Xanthobacteraceae bacterium]|jgi:predicted nucleic-acid-binding protein